MPLLNKKNNVKILKTSTVYLCSLIGISAAFAKELEPSLMYTPNEVQSILVARGLENTSKDNGSSITCQAILYMDSNNWTIWVNGQKISSQQKHPEFQVISVNHQGVELLWTHKNQTLPVTLGVGDLHMAHNLKTQTHVARLKD